MSPFTHRCCDDCWVNLFGDEEASRVIDDVPGACCFCLNPTESGIYLSAEPQEWMKCQGKTGIHLENKEEEP